MLNSGQNPIERVSRLELEEDNTKKCQVFAALAIRRPSRKFLRRQVFLLWFVPVRIVSQDPMCYLVDRAIFRSHPKAPDMMLYWLMPSLWTPRFSRVSGDDIPS